MPKSFVYYNIKRIAQVMYTNFTIITHLIVSSFKISKKTNSKLPNPLIPLVRPPKKKKKNLRANNLQAILKCENTAMPLINCKSCEGFESNRCDSHKMTDVLLFMTTCVLRALDTIIYICSPPIAALHWKVIVYATRNKALSHVSGFSIWLLGEPSNLMKRGGLDSFQELSLMNSYFSIW